MSEVPVEADLKVMADALWTNFVVPVYGVKKWKKGGSLFGGNDICVSNEFGGTCLWSQEAEEKEGTK